MVPGQGGTSPEHEWTRGYCGRSGPPNGFGEKGATTGFGMETRKLFQNLRPVLRLLHRVTTCMVPPGAITLGARGSMTRNTGPTRSSISGYGFTASPLAAPLAKN